MTHWQQLMASVAITACWAAVVVAWVIGGIYNAARGPRVRRRPAGRAYAGAVVIVTALVLAAARLVPARDWRSLRVHAPWATVLGLLLLLAATAFTLWARVVLGTMWSMDAVAKQGHELRTDGPYAVTRHPIYTGMLGMLLGSVLLAGAGRALLLVPVGLVFFEVKLHLEERLLSEAFPEDYARYRRRVPRLVPGLRPRRRRQHAA